MKRKTVYQKAPGGEDVNPEASGTSFHQMEITDPSELQNGK
jgi:hypothetical protein